MSGVRPSATTSTDWGAGTSDAARASSEERIDGDVAMGGDSADDNSAGHPNPSGSDSRGRITAKREPREARVEQSSTTEQHVPRRLFGKTTPQGHAVAVTTQEALDGSREKTEDCERCELRTVGSDKHRNMECRNKDKDHIEFLCELCEAQVTRG